MAHGSPPGARGESEEIATSTLAEIYAQQGLLGRALAIYRRMLARSPEDTGIAERIERLERRIAEAGSPEAATPADAPGESVTSPRPDRERLPWDPPLPVLAGEGALVAPPEPAVESPEPAQDSPEPAVESPEPAMELPEPAAESPEPAAETEDGVPAVPHRVGPIDPRAFAAWLESR